MQFVVGIIYCILQMQTTSHSYSDFVIDFFSIQQTNPSLTKPDTFLVNYHRRQYVASIVSILKTSCVHTCTTSVLDYQNISISTSIRYHLLRWNTLTPWPDSFRIRRSANHSIYVHSTRRYMNIHTSLHFSAQAYIFIHKVRIQYSNCKSHKLQ